jgi:transposase
MTELFNNDEMEHGKPNQSGADSRNKKEQIFKPYTMEQQDFFIGSLEDLVPKTHIARMISAVVDRLDLSYLRRKYAGGGTSAYEPAMLLKVWLLGYCYLTYTCRPLAKALKENVVFMWISNSQKPDFRSLNNFRLLLKEDIQDVFARVVQLAVGFGIVDGTSAFLDGTIIQADANRHKIVWRKSVKKNLAKIQEEAAGLAAAIMERSDEEQKDEDRKSDDDDNDGGSMKREISIEEALKMAEEIEKTLKRKRKNEGEKEVYKNAKRLRELDKREKAYMEKEAVLGDRNSYAKTDPDAIAIMDKEGINRAGYTEVIVTQNQIVLNYEVENCGERRVLKAAVNGCEANTGIGLKELTGDGNFGDEENYGFLDKKGIAAYVKYNRYYKEKSKKWNEENVGSNQFKKVEGEDALVCPAGKKLKLESVRRLAASKTYMKEVKLYRASCEDCACCPLKEKCTSGDARRIDMSERYEELKKKANELLGSVRGKKLCRRRGFEVETVFGDRKRNRKNRRFHLRGLSKVRIETGLLYTMHNLQKIHGYILEHWRELLLKMKQIQGETDMKLLGFIG